MGRPTPGAQRSPAWMSCSKKPASKRWRAFEVAGERPRPRRTLPHSHLSPPSWTGAEQPGYHVTSSSSSEQISVNDPRFQRCNTTQIIMVCDRRLCGLFLHHESLKGRLIRCTAVWITRPTDAARRPNELCKAQIAAFRLT